MSKILLRTPILEEGRFKPADIPGKKNINNAKVYKPPALSGKARVGFCSCSAGKIYVRKFYGKLVLQVLVQ